MEKLHELFVAANNLQPHEDKYDFQISAHSVKDGKTCKWGLTVSHEYVNKTAHHPISQIYFKGFNEVSEEMIQEIKEKLISRQTDLIRIRESECSKRLEEYRRLNEETMNRIVHLEQIKKI